MTLRLVGGRLSGLLLDERPMNAVERDATGSPPVGQSVSQSRPSPDVPLHGRFAAATRLSI